MADIQHDDINSNIVDDLYTEVLHTQSQLYLAAIGLGSGVVDQEAVDNIKLDFPDLLRMDDRGNLIAHLEDYVDFLEKSSGFSHEFCVNYLQVSPVCFKSLEIRTPRKRGALEVAIELIKKSTGLELDEFSYSLFAKDDRSGVNLLIDHLMAEGRNMKQIFKALTDIRFHTKSMLPGLIADEKIDAAPITTYVLDLLALRLFNSKTTDACLDFVAVNVTSGEGLKYLLSKYITDPNLADENGQELNPDPVNLCRDQSGALRPLTVFKSTIKDIFPALIRSALHFDDVDAFKVLRSYQLFDKVSSDDFIEDTAEEIVSYYKKKASTNPEFDLSSRWLFKVYGNPIRNFWRAIDNSSQLRSSFCDIRKDDEWGLVFRPELIAKVPAEYIGRILEPKSTSTQNANIIIHEVHKQGIDCYGGFLLTALGRVLYEYHRHDPADYQHLIRMCLVDLKKAGNLGFLSTAPIKMLIEHPQRAEFLEPLYKLTGDQRLLPAMGIESRAKAFGQDLGL